MGILLYISTIVVALVFSTSASQCPDGASEPISVGASSRIYYVCIKERRHIMKCDSDYVYDAKSKRCAEAVDLKESPEPRIPSPHADQPYCSPDQLLTILLAHESDCNKFYSCSQGFLTEGKCVDGLEFSPEKQNCVWPKPGGCYSKTTTPTPTTTELPVTTTPEPVTTTPVPVTTTPVPVTTTPVPVTTTPVPDTTTTEAPETTTEDPGPYNPCKGNSGVSMVPHETQCDAFYVCVDEHAEMLVCGEGDEFDPTVDNCVPISDNGCFANQPTTTVPFY